MSAWAILGLAPTADAAAIRRAYARRLKETRPEDDPDAFHRLRAAREAALEDAARRRGPEPVDPPESPGVDAAALQPRPQDAAVEPPPAAPPQPRERVRITDADESLRPGPRPPRVSVLDDGPQGSVDRDRVTRERVVETADLAEAPAREDRLGPALEACLQPLRTPRGTVDVRRLDGLLRAASALPGRQRTAIEARVLKALTAGLRTPQGAYDPGFARRVRPLLVAADLQFGWASDDALLTDTLSPRDADFVTLLLNESAREADRASGLRPADAKAIVEDWPSYAALRGSLARPGPVPLRVRWFAFLMPHLWALRHRMWGVAVLLYGALALPPVLAATTLDDPGFDALRLLPGAILTLAICAGTGLAADRLIAAAARRTVRRANARGLFERGERERFLKGSLKPFRPPVLMVFYVFGVVTFFPYLGLAVTLGRALGLD